MISRVKNHSDEVNSSKPRNKDYRHQSATDQFEFLNNPAENFSYAVQVFGNIDDLYEEIFNMLSRFECFIDSLRLIKESTQIIIDWRYDVQSKFDIYEAQMLLATIVAKYKNVRPSYFSGPKNLSIIRII